MRYTRGRVDRVREYTEGAADLSVEVTCDMSEVGKIYVGIMNIHIRIYHQAKWEPIR